MPWLWRVGLKQGRGLGGGRCLCLGPTGLEKALGAMGGWGLDSTEQKGPRRTPHPWSQRAGDLTWEPSRLPGLEWVGQTPSSPLLFLLEDPSHLPLLISPASGAPILSGLHFSSPLSPPTSYRFTWGFLPSPWTSGSPPAAGRCPSCGETLTRRLHTPSF